MTYHIWTLGCQMNTADSQHLASELERMGHQAALNPDDADIYVVNTCVVRQSAEDKALGRLGERIGSQQAGNLGNLQRLRRRTPRAR